MLRIIAGSHKGRRLVTPAGMAVRPTSGRARAALFNILGQWITDKRVLELFAGCGSIGFECLSRGARAVAFAEREAVPLACLGETTRILGEAARVDVFAAEVPVALDRLRGTMFDLVFADPPYRGADISGLLALIAAAEVTGPDSVVIIEHASASGIGKGDAFSGWECYRAACYSLTQFSFFSRVTEQENPS